MAPTKGELTKQAQRKKRHAASAQEAADRYRDSWPDASAYWQGRANVYSAEADALTQELERYDTGPKKTNDCQPALRGSLWGQSVTSRGYGNRADD